jgi:hypothetical protein
MTQSNGEKAREHMLLHNDLVNNFGTDKTGALSEGLAGATNPPSNLGAAYTANASNMGTSSRVLTAPSKTATCTSTSGTRTQAVGIDAGYIDSGLTI